jgi:hypothetical protein
MHRPSGQAVVILSGRDCDLGRHGAKANRLEYDRLIAEWLANGRQQIVSAIGMPKPWSRFALLMRRFLDNCWL